jgi:hypothetical protein
LERSLNEYLSASSASDSSHFIGSDELEALFAARDQLHLQSGQLNRLKADRDLISRFISTLPLSPTEASSRNEQRDEVVLNVQEDGAWQHVLNEGVNGSALSVSYRHQLSSPSGSHIHEVRLEGLMHCDALHLIALLMEVDLYSSWMPSLLGIGLRQSKAIPLTRTSHSSSRMNYTEALRRAGHFEIALPWPLPNLDLCIFGFGLDALADHNALLLVLRDVASEDVESIPSIPSSSRRLQLHVGGAVIEPIDAHLTRVSFSFVVDPHIDSIPQWLITLVLKTFAGMVWEGLASNARLISSQSQGEHARRMKEDSPETYAFVRSRVNDAYLKR